MTGAVKTDTANSKENTVKEEIGMTLLICLVYSDTNDEEEEETPLTVRILFSLERCLLMGDTETFLNWIPKESCHYRILF